LLNKVKFVTIFPEIQNKHLFKDICLIPYFMGKYLGYSSKLLCYKNGEYPTLDNELKGFNVEFLEKIYEDSLKDGVEYIKNNYKDIDILYVNEIWDRSFNFINNYLNLKKDGKVYLKLDANIGYMNRLHLKNPEIEILQRCKVISVENKKLYNYLNKKWPLKIEYIPNGYFNFNHEEKVIYEEKENIILTVGRIGTWQKANEILLEAFNLVSNEIPNWKIKFIGGIEKDFERYINKFMQNNPNLKDKIIFSGEINSRKRLEEEYKKSKIFCLTSRFEGFPNVFPEAAIKGCYIISTNIDPAWDITDNQKYGSIFDIDNVEQLASLLKRICKDEEILKRTCEDIQNYISENFNWIDICKKLDLLINM
jgi:glycosyltransferase involved in cell wall biosynthesis